MATGIGRTSDLLVDGVPYDVYTPQAGTSVRNIFSKGAKKWNQVNGGGIVIDLSETSLTPADFGDAFRQFNRLINRRINGIPLSDIIFFKR